MRILIVEDHAELQRALRINLRARGYDVAVASAGRQALAEARHRPPDVVLLDLGLPDLDGTEVIRDLRAWSRAPVIVLSGRAGSEDSRTAGQCISASHGPCPGTGARYRSRLLTATAGQNAW